MAQQEQKEKFQVYITTATAKSPNVNIEIEWDNGETDPLKKVNYKEERKYPHLKSLVKQVSREKILRKLEYTGAWVFVTVGDLSAMGAILFGNFGEYDTAIKISSVVAGVGANIGGIVLGADSMRELPKASAILRQVQKQVTYSIVPNLP